MPAVQTGITTIASGQILTTRDFLVSDGFHGAPFQFNPNPGAVQATATITVTTTPVGAGTVAIGFPGFTTTLSTAGGARTPGLNDFDNTLGAVGLIAADIAAAINDVANGFAVIPGVTALAVGPVVTITFTTAGTYANSATMVSTCAGLQLGATANSMQTPFSGGLDNGYAGAGASWLIRGLCAVNVEGLRSIYIQLYHYSYYLVKTVAPAPAGLTARVPAREYLTWRPVARSAPLVNQAGTAWPYEPASEWFPLAAPQICPIGVPISTRLDVGGMSEVSIEISQDTFPNQTIVTGGMGVAPWPTTAGSPFTGNDRFRLVITAAA